LPGVTIGDEAENLTPPPTACSSSSSDTDEQEDLDPMMNDKLKRLEVYRLLLKKLLPESHDIPAAQLAQIMRRITASHTELNAQVRKPDAPTPGKYSDKQKFSRRYIRPTSDPLFGVKVCPLALHLILFLATEALLRMAMWALGFKRGCICSTTYYYNPNTKNKSSGDANYKTPIVFIHGIGLGVIMYLPLVFGLLKTGRPIFLPEVPFVSAFRPWVMPSAIQSPVQVAASLTAMLANYGYHQATFSGHSYGSFWLAYVAKYAPSFVSALVFLDPVCFCLYHARLTTRFVYHLPDPGDVSYIVRTDLMVKWAVQRNFSWARGNLFVEDIADKPCAVFVSSDDRLAPSVIQESYLRRNGATVKDFADVCADDFESSDLSVTVFRGDDHGGWVKNPFETSPKIVECIEILSTLAETNEYIERLLHRKTDSFLLRSSIIVPGFDH
jgi:pimeloyl-ACP methyl ester carboxylesterase